MGRTSAPAAAAVGEPGGMAASFAAAPGLARRARLLPAAPAGACARRPGASGARCATEVGRAGALRAAIARTAGAERGLFVVPRAERAALDALIRAVEEGCAAGAPAADGARAVAGRWRLLYTTLTILGRRRAALAIATGTKPGFVRIADVTQEIVPGAGGAGRSVNEVRFRLLTGGEGRFVLDAAYTATGPRRVEVQLAATLLEPEKLQAILGENVALLTEIFNPTGFLDITYLDNDLRVGRDHNGHVFVLEKIKNGEEGS